MTVCFQIHCSLDQRLWELGKNVLRALGVTKVFDLRSDTEIRKYNAPLPQIEGVDVVHIPVFQTADYSPEMMAKCVRVEGLLHTLPVSHAGLTGDTSCMLAERLRCVIVVLAKGLPLIAF